MKLPLSATLCAALFLHCQPSLRGQDDPARTFAALAPKAQAAVLAKIEARLRDEPLVRYVREVADTCPQVRQAIERTYYDEKVFAPVAPARRLVQATDRRHRTARRSAPAIQPFASLAPRVVYDWGTGRVVRVASPPNHEERFAALIRGLPPRSDEAIAALLARLDSDGRQREIASWFEHLYADRNGRVFAGITLYEAWYSGQTVEVPDVDAIAFARSILQTDSFVSPIPDGRRRARLYAQIKDAFASHREYRTLRECLALAFVSAEPELDATYAPLLPRLHHLWGWTDFDVNAAEQRLGGEDRATILEVLDRESGADVSLRVKARDALAEMGAKVRAVVVEEVLAASRSR